MPNICMDEFSKCLEEARKIPDESTRSLFEAECRYAYKDCLGKGEVFNEIFSKRILESLARKYEDMVLTRYTKCISKILVHPISRKCVSVLTGTGITRDIVNLEKIDYDKVKKILMKNKYDISISECIEVAKQLEKACKACLEYAKKPLECIKLQLDDTSSPDDIEVCWELVDKLEPSIIVI